MPARKRHGQTRNGGWSPLPETGRPNRVGSGTQPYRRKLNTGGCVKVTEPRFRGDGWVGRGVPAEPLRGPAAFDPIDPARKTNREGETGESRGFVEWPKKVRRDLALRRLGRDASPHPAGAPRHIAGCDRAFGTFEFVKFTQMGSGRGSNRVESEIRLQWRQRTPILTQSLVFQSISPFWTQFRQSWFSRI